MIHIGRKEQGYKGNSVETKQGADEGNREDGEEEAEAGEGGDKG